MSVGSQGISHETVASNAAAGAMTAAALPLHGTTAGVIEETTAAGVRSVKRARSDGLRSPLGMPRRNRRRTEHNQFGPARV